MVLKTDYEHLKGYISRFEENEQFKEDYGQLNNDPSYEDVYRTAAGLFKDNATPSFVSNVNIFFHMFHMKQSGEKIYHITPGLSARLAQTSVDVDSYFIKSPFREIYIQIEPGLFYMKDLYKKEIPVTGFFVYLKEIGDFKQLRVLATGLPETPEGSPFSSIYYLKMEFKPGKIQKQVRDYISEHLKMHMEDTIRFGGLQNIDYWDEFMFFILNTLLYITSKNPDFSNYVPEDIKKRLCGLKSTAKKQKLEHRLSKYSRHSIIVVGAGITGKHVQDIQNTGGVGAWKLKYQVKVSGYWRVQWYGSESDKTRRAETIWICDYTKGPELAETLKTPYLVK